MWHPSAIMGGSHEGPWWMNMDEQMQGLCLRHLASNLPPRPAAAGEAQALAQRL